MAAYQRDDFPEYDEEDGDDYGPLVGPHRNEVRYSPNTAASSATTVVPSPSFNPARRFQTTEENRRGALSKKTTESSSKASSSKIRRRLEMVQLEEKGLRAKVEMQESLLRLNELELKKLRLEDELEEEEEDDVTLALNDVANTRTGDWVEQAKNNKRPPSSDDEYPPPSYRATETERPPPAYRTTEMRRPPPLHRIPFTGGHQRRSSVPPPPPPGDPMMQLTEALKAVVMQPQKQMERFMACQTLGRDLPTFNGNVEEWPAFICYYKTSTQECKLSPSQNLVRLQRCLKGEAREIVNPLLVSTANVDEIIRVLEKHFGQPNTIIRMLMKKVKETPAASEGKPESLVKLAGVVRNLVQTVTSLGRINHLQNPQLLEELADKLPHGLRLEWASNMVHLRPAEADLNDFSRWLEKVSDAALLLNRSTPVQASSGKKQYGDRRRDTTGKPEVTLAAEEEEHKTTCLYCDKTNHKTEECRALLKLDQNERMEWVKSKGCCFSCLRKGHAFRLCRRKKKCGEEGCTRLHHPLLHSPANNEDNFAKPLQKKGNEDGNYRFGTESRRATDPSNKKEEMNGNTITNDPDVYLQILPVLLHGPRGQVSDYAFLDQGSTATVIDESLCAQLGLEGPADPLTLRWLDGSVIEDQESQRVRLGIRGKYEKTNFSLQNVRSVKDLRLRVQSVTLKKLKKHWKHLQHVPLEDMINVRPRILVGSDHIRLIITRELTEGPPNAPLASKCKLGWSICGRQNLQKGRVDMNFVFSATEESEQDRVLHELVKSSFAIDALGINVNSNNLKSKQDARAEAMMTRYTRKVGQRFEVPLLWKDDIPLLPNNYDGALGRLNQIERKMDRDPVFAAEYCKKVQYYLDVGYARKLNQAEVKDTNNKTWVLPHFFAYHPNKPGKPRFVFDAAAEKNGVSLNKKLMTGPDVLKSLPGIIMKFREKKIGFTADIKEMFHQVLIRKEDQQAQRFLWRGMDRRNPPEQYVMQVMTFGATCSPYAAQFVKNLNAMEHQEKYPAAANSIINHHYVDDLADGADTEFQAVMLIKEIIHVHKQSGFEIVKWSCSSREVLERIPEELRAVEAKVLELKSDLPVERVLGLIWSPSDDWFQFSINFNKVDKDIITGVRMPTKREVLKTVMSVFDPLGFLSHYIIKAKILYQQVWRSNIVWDEGIHEQQQIIWRKWIEKLPAVKELRIPRYYFGGYNGEKLELHIFCDSSAEAYASIGYLRWRNGDHFEVKMVCSKARVAPLKPMSIPRLELQSALISVRMNEFIRTEQNLDINATTYWTDAKTVILWLQSDVNRYKQYVAHRVGEILEKSSVADWNWLPTKLNVADEATRSGSDVNLSYDSRWFMGPSFLYDEKENWSWVNPKFQEDPAEMEVKKEFCGLVLPEKKQSHLPEVTRFSSWARLIRSTAMVRRFVQIKFNLNTKALSQELTVQDLMWSQKEWWKQVQRECFPYEYAALRDGKPLPKESRILFLSPFMDNEGIIRVTSRTVHSPEMKMQQKQPVVLDPSHAYTKLLINQYHLWAAHQGQEYVINELRQRYWILRIRVAVKSVWNSCLQCKHRKARPVVAEMSPLPQFRLTRPVRPFTVCGIDYFGPLNTTKFRRHEKKWVALFTCMHTRAVHLELVDSLSTDSVIMAMIRMASVRGWPKTYYSDNGTNFRGASVELNKSLKELDQKKIVGELALKQVEWKFIPPSAPHFGGAWERLVRSVKKVLGVLLKEQAPKEELLKTVLAEATNIVNSRPLTYVPNDIGDPEVLTPNCFLFGTTSGAPVLAEIEGKNMCPRKQWMAAQQMADLFWKRWVKEYLPTLTRRSKWAKGTVLVKKGDVVIIVDDNAPRNLWLKGIVTETFPGRDGIVRVADVRTQNGTFRRPVVKLCVLEGINQDSVPDASGTAEGSMLANADCRETKRQERLFK